MNAAVAIAPLEELPESQRSALLKLLADEDPSVHLAVREKILSFGPGVVQWLQPHTLSNDPPLRRRAQDIIQHFSRQTADNQFLAFCLKHGEEFDLETGAWLLAQTQYPAINLEGTPPCWIISPANFRIGSISTASRRRC